MIAAARFRASITFVALFSGAAAGQVATPKFDIADVHASTDIRNPNMQGGVFRAGRYELRRATMLDLIKTAYGVDADTVFGGPSWLEWDRFDVIAKAPPATSPETVKRMLQSLLADRFKLVVHKDTKPIQGFVLSLGRGKPKLKAADGSGEPGCQPQRVPSPTPGLPAPAAVSCRSTTMTEFAATLRGLDGGYFTGPVMNQTSLAGAWDFDLKWTDKRLLSFAGDDGLTIFDAVEKQLGLTLEPKKVPMPVLVVDSVNEKPTANSPAVTTSLPPPPPPEFEVASIRPSLPGAPMGGGGFMPGGRVEWRGLPLALLILQAWDLNIAPDEIPGAPKWLKPFQPAFDLIAKAPASAIASGTQLYNDDYNLMMRALLVDRFKMATHYEDRPLDAYTLVAAKPKLKKADPSNRTGCKTERSQAPRDSADGPPPMIATCQNISMAQFAERLQTIAPNYLRYPALDATGLDGAWDFTLTFSPIAPNQLAAGGGGVRGGSKGGGPAPAGGGVGGAASDPVGGISLFEAVDKQLGLKLEVHKRPEPVFVIDHIEENPTDN